MTDHLECIDCGERCDEDDACAECSACLCLDCGDVCLECAEGEDE